MSRHTDRPHLQIPQPGESDRSGIRFRLSRSRSRPSRITVSGLQSTAGSGSLQTRQRSRPCRAMKGEPVFAEPWQAHAFALAVKLSERGLFTWAEWSATLAEELAKAN